MTRQHQALIYLSVEFTSGVDRLRQVLHDLRESGETIEISSVYKRFLTTRHEDLNSEICLVVKFETGKSEADLDRVLQDINNGLLQAPRKHGRLLLLSYDQVVQLLPQMTLPHPQLRNDGLTLRCAAEVWGGYEHPVLGQSLNELVKLSEPMKTTEFFAQGKGL